MAIVLYMTVEGVGQYTGAGYRWFRWCTRRPTTMSASTNIYQGGMALPAAVGTAIDPLTGSVSYSSLTVDLPTSSFVAAEFLRSYTIPTTYVTADNGATIAVNSAAGMVAGQTVIWVGTEACYVTNIVATTLTVTRAQFGTAQSVHPPGTYVYLRNPILYLRRVALYETDDQVSYTTLRWAGVIENVTTGDDLASITIDCQSASMWLEGKLGSDRWEADQVFHIGEGRVSILNLAATATQAAQLYSAANGGITIGDPAGHVRMGDHTYPILHVRPGEYHIVDDPYPKDGEGWLADIEQQGHLTGETVSEVLSSHRRPNAPFYRIVLAGGAYEQTLNPLHIFLMVLLSGIDDNYDPADAYDYSTLGRTYGLRFPRAQLDVPAFEAMALRLDGVEATAIEIRQMSGVDLQAALLWPLGVMVVPNAAGLLTPIVLSDIAPYSAGVISVAMTDLEEPLTQVDRQLHIVLEQGQLKFFGEDDYQPILLEQAFQWYGGAGQGQYEVDAAAYSRARSETIIRARVLDNVKRLLFPPPSVSCRVSPAIAELISVGSLIQLTHPFIPDATDPDASITSAGLFVIDERILPDKAFAKDVLGWLVSHDLSRFALISPALDVRYHDGPNFDIYYYAPTFAVAATEEEDQWQVGDRLLLCTANGEPRSDPAIAQVEISAIDEANLRITLDADFQDGGGVIYADKGDIIIHCDYDSASAMNVHDRYHYLAGSDGLVGVAGDAGYQYGGGV